MAYELGMPVSMSGVILGMTLKGDLTIEKVNGKDLVVDVTNQTAWVMTNEVDKTKKDFSQHLKKAEDDKQDKYEELCKDAGKEFSPFAASMWGAFGPSCNQVLGMLANRLHELEMISMSKAFVIVCRRVPEAAFMQIAVNGLMELDKMETKRLVNESFQRRVDMMGLLAEQWAQFVEGEFYGHKGGGLGMEVSSELLQVVDLDVASQLLGLLWFSMINKNSSSQSANFSDAKFLFFFPGSIRYLIRVLN
jgi:hypothetical protein